MKKYSILIGILVLLFTYYVFAKDTHVGSISIAEIPKVSQPNETQPTQPNKNVTRNTSIAADTQKELREVVDLSLLHGYKQAIANATDYLEKNFRPIERKPQVWEPYITIFNGAMLTANFCFLIFLYRRFNRRQVLISRRSILRELEEDIMAIHESETARVQEDPDSRKLTKMELRYVLDDKESSPWLYKTFKDENGKDQLTHEREDCRRYWLIREQPLGSLTGIKQYVSSDAFHSALLWFRRAKNAYQEGVVSDADLVSLWRQTLPFAVRDRLFYLTKYFDTRQDVFPIVFITVKTLRACIQAHQERPLTYFKEHSLDFDREILREEYPKYTRELRGDSAIVDAIRGPNHNVKKDKS